MNKDKTPPPSETKAKVHNSLSDLFETQPAKPPQKNKANEQDANKEESEETSQEPKTPKISNRKDEKTSSPQKEKPSRNVKTKNTDPKTYRILTYVTEKDYDDLEEVFDKIKRKIRKKTGKQLKVTNISELLLKYAAVRFNENQTEVLEEILKEIQ